METDLTRETSPRVAQALTQPRLAFLALGACEQHGAHLPLSTDTVMAQGLARRLAAAEGGLLLPPLPYGDAWNNEGFAGTLSISTPTLQAVLADLAGGVRRMGAAGLVLVNGHFGNRIAAGLTARAFAAEGFAVLCLDYPGLPEAAGLLDSAACPHGLMHADEFETSVMLALAPEAVRMELAAAEYPEFPPTFAQEPVPLDQISRSGVFGDPRPATAEKGAAILAVIERESRLLIAAFRQRHGLG